MNIPCKVWINKISDGLGDPNNDIKYIGGAHDRVVTIVHQLNHSMFLTDFFIPEYIDSKNDYIHYGFLIVSKGNFVPVTANNITDFGI